MGRDHHDLTPIRRRGLRVTIPTRTIIDCAAVARHSRRGRSGIGPVRRVLRDWPYSDQVAESVLELRMQTLLHGTPFDHDVTQLEIGPYRVDFAWSDERIVLECDGGAKVDSPEHFEKAARRDSFLQTQGWIVLHFTWREITRRPSHVVTEIQRAFRHRRFGETGGRFTRNT